MPSLRCWLHCLLRQRLTANSRPAAHHALSVLQAEDMTCLLNYGAAEQPELHMLQPEAELQHSWACSMHEELFEPGEGELRNLGLFVSQAMFVYALSLVRSRTFSEEVRLHCRLSSKRRPSGQAPCRNACSGGVGPRTASLADGATTHRHQQRCTPCKFSSSSSSCLLAGSGCQGAPDGVYVVNALHCISGPPGQFGFSPLCRPSARSTPVIRHVTLSAVLCAGLCTEEASCP